MLIRVSDGVFCYMIFIRMKIDNRNKPKDAHGKKMDKKCRPVFGKTHKLVMIGGTAYRANKMRLERVTNTGKRTRRRSSSQKCESFDGTNYMYIYNIHVLYKICYIFLNSLWLR